MATKGKILNGGPADDTFYVQFDEFVHFDGGGGTDTAGGWVDFDETRDQVFTIDGRDAEFRTADSITATFHDIESYFIQSGSGNDTLDGTGAQSVHFHGYDGNDTLIGSRGDDRLNGGRGDDTVTGGRGDDHIEDDGGRSDVDAGSGDDAVDLTDAVGTVVAGAGDDAVTAGLPYRLWASPAIDLDVDLGRGDDVVTLLSMDGASGRGDLRGGVGEDTARLTLVRAENTVIDLAHGVDAATLHVSLSGFEHLEATTGSGDDTLIGGAHADILDAGSGDDTVLGRGGNDQLALHGSGSADGGSGRDTLTLDLSARADGVSFTFTPGAAVQVDADTSFTRIERLNFVGTAGDDDVTGSSAADVLADGAGDDRLEGRGGADHFIRGEVDRSTTWDEVIANLDLPPDARTDVIDGGAGIDTLSFAPRNMPIDFMQWIPVIDRSIVLDLQDATQNAGLAAGLTVINVERFVAGDGADTLRGSSAGETLIGGADNDILDGRGGSDRVEGGAGADDLTGGGGRDVFVYARGWDAAWRYGYGNPEDTSGDHIRDFTHGEDRLAFTTLRANTAVNSGDDLSWSGRRAQFAFDESSHELWFDADGTGTQAQAVRVATLDGVDHLDHSDFLFG